MDYDAFFVALSIFLFGYRTRTVLRIMRLTNGFYSQTIMIPFIVCFVVCVFSDIADILHSHPFSTCTFSYTVVYMICNHHSLINVYNGLIESQLLILPLCKAVECIYRLYNILTCLVICYTVFYTWLINIHPTIIANFWSTCLDKIPGFISNGFTPQFSILENFANYAVMYSVTYDTCIVWLTCSALYLAVLKPYDSEVKQFCIIFLIAVLIFNDLRIFLRYLVRPFFAFAVLDFRPLCMCNMWFQQYHIFALTSFRPCCFLPFILGIYQHVFFVYIFAIVTCLFDLS